MQMILSATIFLREIKYFDKCSRVIIVDLIPLTIEADRHGVHAVQVQVPPDFAPVHLDGGHVLLGDADLA